jgi:hypothetical protein
MVWVMKFISFFIHIDLYQWGFIKNITRMIILSGLYIYRITEKYIQNCMQVKKDSTKIL